MRLLIASSRNFLLALGSPFTNSRSSGANITLNTIPRISRTFFVGDPLMLAVFCPSLLSTTERSILLTSCSTMAVIIADWYPELIRGVIPETRWLSRFVRYPIASTILVFPIPFGPIRMETPGANFSITFSYDRKFCNAKDETCISYTVLALTNTCNHLQYLFLLLLLQ